MTINHGTPSGYKQGCRLECCRKAKRDERTRLAAAKASEPKPATTPRGSVLEAVREELGRQADRLPVLFALAEALAREIDRGGDGMSIAGATKQLAAVVAEVKATTSGGSKSDAIVTKWGRPTIVPAAVRNGT